MSHFPRKYPPEMTRSKMMDWCNKAERSQQDIRNKLYKWNIPTIEIENLIVELISMDLINESRYASAFAHDKSAIYRWGTEKIKMHLKARGISDRNISDALKNIDPEKTMETISGLIRKRMPALKGLKDYQKKFKLMKYLSGKGFRSSEINQALANLAEEDYS